LKSVTLKARPPESSRRPVHMHCMPAFIRTSPHIIVRRLHAAIENHNWRQNSYAVEARLFSGKRLAIRSEARMTLKAVCKAIAFYVNYAPDSNQFECWANVPHLAKQVGAMYLVDDERVRYDTIYHALELLESMQAVHIVREYDRATKRNKLNRVFILPAFFRMFGFSDNEVRELVRTNKKMQDKLPVHELEKISHIWGRNRCSPTEKAQIRGKAAAKKINWTQKHYQKAENDHTNLELIRGLGKAVKVESSRPSMSVSDESVRRARLRDGLSQVELWKLKSQLEAPGMTPADVDTALDLYLAQRQRE